MKRILKILGAVILGLVILILAAALFFNSRTSSRMEQRFEVQPVLSSVEPDSATLARGEHVALIQACSHCHGENLGGSIMMDMPLWRMTAPNITSGAGGVGGDYTVEDWDRAIRLGVAKDGRPLMIMPSEVYQNMSDQDTEALIAYLQTVPAVDNELPAREIRFLGGVMLGMGGFDPANLVREAGVGPEMTPAHLPNEELGEYQYAIACEGCHGADFSGKESENPDCPPSPPLAASAAWNLGDFTTTIRTGTNPNGRELIDQCMPWTAFSHLTDVEIEALHKYLRSATGVAG